VHARSRRKKDARTPKAWRVGGSAEPWSAHRRAMRSVKDTGVQGCHPLNRFRHGS